MKHDKDEKPKIEGPRNAKSGQLGPSALGQTADGVAVNFKAAFCSRYSCSKEEYAQKLFWMTLYSHARPFVMILLPFMPKQFRTDFELIHDVGETEHPVMFRDEIDIFYGNNRREGSFLRNQLCIRISGKRMKRVGEAIYGVKMR